MRNKSRPSQIEVVILRLLENRIAGELYAAQMLNLAGDRLTAGSIYKVLLRMVTKDYLCSRKEELGNPDARYYLRHYRLTEAGKQAVKEVNDFDDNIRGISVDEN